jgi:outer membrane protein assembly factor BamB
VTGTTADVDMTDLAVTPAGELYTISRTSIYSVNRTTAKATKLALDPLTSSNVALTCLIDGTILAADADGNLREIDIANNRVISRGAYGGGFDTAGDLVVILDGTVFGISKSGPGSTLTSNVLITVDVANNGRATGVGPIGFESVFGVAYNNGRVLAFTKDGDIITIDPATGKGTRVKSTGEAFYGAGSSPLVPPVG